MLFSLLLMSLVDSAALDTIIVRSRSTPSGTCAGLYGGRLRQKHCRTAFINPIFDGRLASDCGGSMALGVAGNTVVPLGLTRQELYVGEVSGTGARVDVAAGR